VFNLTVIADPLPVPSPSLSPIPSTAPRTEPPPASPVVSSSSGKKKLSKAWVVVLSVAGAFAAALLLALALYGCISHQQRRRAQLFSPGLGLAPVRLQGKLLRTGGPSSHTLADVLCHMSPAEIHAVTRQLTSPSPPSRSDHLSYDT
jgi:hypothetical protein